MLTFLEGFMAGVWTAIPCVIESVNVAAMTVTLQPSIQGKIPNPDGSFNFVDLPVLPDVPLFFPSGGGFTFTFPVKKGDEALAVFSSRCIDSWWQNGCPNGNPQPPAEFRMHDLSDAFAFVGFRSQPRVVASISTTAAQMRSDDYTGPTGTGECVEIGPGKVSLIADEVVIHGRNKATFDAGGTGFVYTPSLITTYTDGVTVSSNPPDPPEVPT